LAGAAAGAHRADARDHGPPPALPQGLRETIPTAPHVRTGLHRARGETTKPIERSPIATGDRLRAARGLKLVRTGQRFLEGFEALRALRGGRIVLERLVPDPPPVGGTPHETIRAVAVALQTLAARLTRRPPRRRAAV
jgi:hypothetical protein